MRKRSLKHFIHLRHLSLVALLTVLFVTISCDRRPLEIYYEGTAQVRINVDWQTSFGLRPTGMTMMLWRQSDTIMRSIITNNVDGQTLHLQPDVYKVVIFNQSYDEFGSMRFEDLWSHNYGAARAEPITTRALRQWDRGTRYMADPEAIGCAVDTFAITPEMIEDYFTFVDYRDRNRQSDTARFTFNEIVHPMTTVLHVRVLVKGFSSMRSLEANISGMADGFYLSRVDRTFETGIMLLDNWSAQPIKEGTVINDTVIAGENWGWVTADIATFGLPLGKERAEWRDSTDNVLNMAFLLHNQAVVTYKFNVGKRMRYYTPTGDALSKAEVLKHIEVEIILDDPLEAPDLPPVPISPDNASGFDARVDEWDDGGTFEIGF